MPEERIPVLVKPVFDVIHDVDFEEGIKDIRTSKAYKALYCYRCGASLFYVVEDRHYNEQLETVYDSRDLFCAVCGSIHSGTSVKLFSRAEYSDAKEVTDEEWKSLIEEILSGD